MDIELLGEYNFDNFTLLNALMNERDRINTAIHEYTHFVLSNQSVYGTILYCLNKLIIPYDSQNDMNKKRTAEKFFLSNTLKLQEGIAVFVEAIYFLLRDKAEYESFMDDLRKNNPSYYGYVKPLCFILEMIRDEERETILSVTHAVFQVALDSMNAEIYVFDGSLFSSNKSIKKMVSQQEFSKKYLPNKRFVSKIKDCKKATSCQELIKLLWDNVEHKVNTTIELTERLEKIKKFILDIFSESKYMHLYKNKLAKINLTEKEVSDVFLQQLPTAFNEDYVARNMKMVNWEMISQKCKKTAYSTIFLLGNLMDNWSDLLLKMGVNEIEKTRDERELMFFYDLINKEIYSCVLEQKQLQEILKNDENKSVLLTSYKNYDYENECIFNHADGNGCKR